jgi:hypothetical protein
MLPSKKTKVYLEMDIECKLASQEKNPKNEVLVVNSKNPKNNPSNHDTKKVLPDCKWNSLSNPRVGYSCMNQILDVSLDILHQNNKCERRSKIMKKPKLNSFGLHEDSPILGEWKVCKFKKKRKKKFTFDTLATPLKLLVKYCCIYNVKFNCLFICSSPLIKPLLLNNIHTDVKIKLPSFLNSTNSSIYNPFNDFRFAICGSPSTSSSLSSMLGLTNTPVVLIINDPKLLSKTMRKFQHTHVAW